MTLLTDPNGINYIDITPITINAIVGITAKKAYVASIHDNLVSKAVFSCILKDENGAEIIIINPTEAEIEDSWNLIYDDYPSLDRISTELARHIRKGHIEMSCVANEKAHYSYMETLTIRSDGSASRSQTVSRDGTTEEFKEAYPEVAT